MADPLMIQAASIYDLRRSQTTPPGIRVLTTRRWLRGVGKKELDFWCPDAGPGEELLKVYRQGQISGEEFLFWYAYEQYICASCHVIGYTNGERTSDEHFNCSPIHFLTNLEKKGNVIIVCWERDRLCHREPLLTLCLDFQHRKYRSARAEANRRSCWSTQ